MQCIRMYCSLLIYHSNTPCFDRENLQQQRDKAAADFACRQEETALKHRKLCLQEQELIDRQLRNLRQDLQDGLVEKDEYRERAQLLRARSDEIYADSSFTK